MYRANFGNGETGRPHLDIRDARLDKWARAGIVQWRTSIERCAPGGWETVEPSRAAQSGPPIEEVRPMTEIHRRGAFYVTSDEPGVYRVWRDGEPRPVCTARGRNAAQSAREECAACADDEARKAAR